MSRRDELTIEMELERLHKRAAELGLTKDDVQKLEILIKARALLKGDPTSVAKTISKAEKLSDEELLKKLEE